MNGMKRLNKVLVFLSVLLHITSVASLSVPRHQKQIKQFTIQVNGYEPIIDDDYIAVAMRISPGYVVRFEPFADANRVHHILLYGCTYPAFPNHFWRGFDICQGYGAHILYAWARNAPDLNLPQDVAFSVGHSFDAVKYLVMQVHYAHPFLGKIKDYSGITLHMIDERPHRLAAVSLFASGNSIPPGFSHFQTNISCIYNSAIPIHPFAFRTHTHSMGRVVSAFYKHAGKWTMIGKRNPQWPQLFQPIEANLTISKDDLMAATCVYDSSMKKSVVRMGSTGNNEMCNFYMMFYWDAALPDPFPEGTGCYAQEQQKLVSEEYPIEGTFLLESHPDWERQAHQSKLFGITEGTATTSVGGITLGQVSALCFDLFGNLVILHRSSRFWDSDSFDNENNLRDKNPIMEDVILVTYPNTSNGTLLLRGKYGSEKFFMPHGLAIDLQNNYYTTDVGSHQVIKWSLLHGSLSQVFVLGEKFVPGDDRKHFCKPAGIVVTEDGSIFVADGYCNNRIMKFDRNGQFITQWGQSSYNTMDGLGSLHLGTFSLPHDIVANSDGSLLYVTDRENARIQIFGSDGHAVGQIVNPENTTVFENIYSADIYNDVLFFVPSYQRSGRPVSIFSAHVKAARVQYSFEPTDYPLNRPHVIRISKDGRYIYVGELGQDHGRILQFIINLGQNQPNQNFIVNPVNDRSSPVLSSVTIDRTSQFLIFTFLPAIVVLSVLIFFSFKRKKLGKHYFVLDRAGFKPLRTKDSESSSDESEDDLCSRREGKNKF